MTNWRRCIPAVIPLILGVYLLATGSGTRDFVMMLAAFAVVGLVVIGVDVAGPVAKLTAGIVNLLSAALALIVGLFLVLPIWIWNRVIRGRRFGTSPTGGWVENGEEDGKPTRTFSEERVVRPATPLMKNLAATLGLVVILVAGDLGAGIVWNHLTNSGERSVAGAIRIDETEFDPDPPPNGVSPHPPDAREDGPAMSRYPWSHDYFQEFQSVRSTYWPFTLFRPLPFKGKYLNIKGWERRSYEPHQTSPTPVIAFLGGSAMFGEGQRDRFTVASYVARIAESEGIPVSVRNFGQRGWVMWQEMTLYEQLLAEGDHFDMSVFYDGANDMTVQTGPVVGVPTHYDAAQYAERMAGGGRVGSAELRSSMFSWWSSRSVVLRAIAKVRGDRGVPVTDSSDLVQKNPDGYGRRGVDVYQRGRHLTQSLSGEYGVVDSYYWQPQNLEAPESDWAAENVGAPTVSLATALDDHLEVYLDNVHTNEEGARLIAEAMWPTLKPKVQAWYAQQDPRPGMPRG